MDSVLRPRDIQARIRSGETPEAVASVAQTTVEKVMVFATPVLAERAWVAEQAQKASVRRRAGNGPIGQLGEAVAEQLSGDDLDPEAVVWDAWRREDGRWTLVADYPADGTRRATFTYDTAGRYVVAEDEEARRLVGERAGAASSSAPSPEVHGEVGLDHDPAQTALGDDAIELVTGRRPDADLEGAAEAGPARPRGATLRDDTTDLAGEATVDLTETARAARATGRSVPAPQEWMSTQATERPAPSEEEALFDAADVAEAVPGSPTPTGGRDGGEAGSDDVPASSEEADGPGGEPAPGKQKPRKTPGKTRKGRASVPSWDEIMFGSGKGD